MNSFKKNYYVIPFFILIFIYSCSIKKDTVFKSDSVDSTECIKVTFDDLVKSPNTYHSKNIEVSGYFVSEFENVSVYKSPFTYYTKNLHEAIWLNFKPDLGIFKNDYYKLLDKNYITVKGKFNFHSNGHLGQYLGEIDDIYFVSKE